MGYLTMCLCQREKRGGLKEEKEGEKERIQNFPDV
jgi:hypothetical protein